MRIASLVPSSTEILFAVGAGASVVARSHECDHPQGAVAIPAVTSDRLDASMPSRLRRAAASPVGDAHTIYELDESALAAARPDVIITQSLCPLCAVGGSTVERCAIGADATVVSADPHTLDEVLASIVDIATAAGMSAAGRYLAARLRSRLHWVSSIVAELEAPRVAVIDWSDPIYAPGHWIPDMVEAAGGLNVFGTSGRPPAPSAVDELAAARPDVVVLAFCGLDLLETQARLGELTSDPAFVEATRFARTFAVDGSAYFSRPGPRLVDGVELLAWALHRSHPRLQPPVGRGAKLIEAGWVDVSALPLAAGAEV